MSINTAHLFGQEPRHVSSRPAGNMLLPNRIPSPGIPSRPLESEMRPWISQSEAPKPMAHYVEGPTCAIEHGQQDGGDPGCVAIANPKLPNELLEEDADSLGEGVGEASDDKAAEEHSPAPASIWGLDTCGVLIYHSASHVQEGWFFLT